MESSQRSLSDVATTEGRFRVYCRVGSDPTGETPCRLALFDGTAPYWVTVEPDDELSSAWPGTVLDGRLLEQGPPLAVEPTRISRTPSLVVGTTEASLPEQVWTTWEERGPNRRRVVGVLDDRTEFHVSSPPASADWLDLWRWMLTGRFSFEPWFRELVELDGGARHLTVVSVPERRVFVFFATTTAGTEVVRRRRNRLDLPHPS